MIPVYPFLGIRKVCRDVKIPFPPQHQEGQPGIESVMIPRPIFDNPEHRGSGKLDGKTAVITGGDSGIGRATAVLFAKEGANPVLSYYNEHNDAEETKKEVESCGRPCVLVPGDLRREGAAQAVACKAAETFGGIDVLVNNHAMQFIQPRIEDITREQLYWTFETNVFSFFYMIQAALPHMKRGGSIINTASITAYAGNKELIDYSAAKGAIVSLTRSLSLSLEERGIRVNGVAPGPVWTPLIPSSYSAGQVETFGTGTPAVPMGRAGQPFEIATSYLFLASDDSSYFSGQVLHPNGGEIVNG